MMASEVTSEQMCWLQLRQQLETRTMDTGVINKTISEYQLFEDAMVRSQVCYDECSEFVTSMLLEPLVSNPHDICQRMRSICTFARNAKRSIKNIINEDEGNELLSSRCPCPNISLQ